MLGQDTFLAVAKLRVAPALAGLRLALFPSDPASQSPTLPTYRDSSFKPTKITEAA